MRHGMILIATLLVTLMLAVPASAAPADLDTGFGKDGVVLTDFTNRDDPRLSLRDDEAHDLALQPDGKIVVVGSADPDRTWTNEVALARYNADGSLDASFGSGGKVTTKHGEQYDGIVGYAVALQPDDKIVVAGKTRRWVGDQYVSSITLLRYNADGSLDASFGSDGRAVVDNTNCCYTVGGLEVQPDGKIVVGGGSLDDGGFLLARFDEAGSPDTSFGSGGMVSTDFGNRSYAGLHDLLIDPNGKIVAAGYSYNGVYKNFALARYNPNGTLDSSFGTAGRVTKDFHADANDSVSSLALAPDGKILAGGQAGEPIVARYNADGSLDASFGSEGKAAVYNDGYSDERSVVSDLSLQPNGKVVGVVSDYGFTSFRLSANGTPDGSYGSYSGDGIAQYPTNDTEYARAVEIQSDGKIVVAGTAWSRFNESGHYDFAMVRYQGGEDTTKPAITPLSPKPGSTIRNTYPTIKATVKDDATQLSKRDIKLYVRGKLVPARHYSYYGYDDGGYRLTYHSSRLPKNKKISVKVVATDRAGNVGSRSWNFRIR